MVVTIDVPPQGRLHRPVLYVFDVDGKVGLGRPQCCILGLSRRQAGVRQPRKHLPPPVSEKQRTICSSGGGGVDVRWPPKGWTSSTDQEPRRRPGLQSSNYQLDTGGCVEGGRHEQMSTAEHLGRSSVLLDFYPSTWSDIVDVGETT